MYVTSHARYADAGRFDPATGELVVFPRGRVETDVPLVEGYFDTLAGHMIVFYRQGDNLFLASGGTTWLADRSTLDWRQVDGQATLTVAQPGRPTLELTYEPYAIPEDDPTPFVEAEHFDFGRYVLNVIHDYDRMQRIYCARFD